MFKYFAFFQPNLQSAFTFSHKTCRRFTDFPGLFQQLLSAVNHQDIAMVLLLLSHCHSLSSSSNSSSSISSVITSSSISSSNTTPAGAASQSSNNFVGGTSSPGPKRRGPSPAIGCDATTTTPVQPTQQQQQQVNDVNQFEPSDSLKRTALHFSCANNQPAIASLLLAVSCFFSCFSRKYDES